ncbi:DUF4139 domain-containing protein [Erythrobacter sp. YT30]|uniref:DUF4139 domain-containing protein n=1 Tax=Erythrobacter sp. YT30 TaxID=1735012 RepID=UPI00076DAD53|nr:DUF4139 domain-containing protein [Erythrobacter sp. YT30]KWV93494.1 hypothetical protein AUC45_03780 [Erythrobacter sp. YT30]
MNNLKRIAGLGLVSAAALAASSGTAQSVPDHDATEQGDVSVTIYNSNLALVQDVRQLDIAQGQSRIEFPDVSARIRPETLSFYAPDTTIVEQNFDYDLLTPTKMMEKAIGQTVSLLRTNPATGAETRERAKVLSTAGGVVIQIGNRIEVLRDDGLPVRVIFDRVPPNLRARPTLSVNLDSTRPGRRPVSLRYLSSGLGWKADYVALYNEGDNSIDMQGWVTLTNNSGTTFHRADTLLVAGNPSGSGGRGFGNRGMTRAGTESADRERLGDFYLYPISGRTTIANAQTKQVSFLDVQGVPARKVYSIAVGWQQNDSTPRNVASAISFSSSRDQGLGDALPAGTVRFYQRDSQGTPQFIGENSIGHTPMGSELTLTTGDAFDITVQAEVEKRETITERQWRESERFQVFDADDNLVSRGSVERQERTYYYRTTMRYTLTNAKDEPIEVDLMQTGLDRYWWAYDYRVVSEDVPGEQINYSRRKYVIPVPAEGKRVVRVVYETRW